MRYFNSLPAPRLVLTLLGFSVLSACGQAENQSQSHSSVSSNEVSGAAGKRVALGQSSLLGTPVWGTRPEWNLAVLKVVQARFGDFDKAGDVEVFCPGYREAPRSAKEHCWVMLAAAITKYESSFKPETSFREIDGTFSVGLMALSPGECPNALTFEALQQPEPNLICGMNRMAALIKKYGNIDGPADNRGASRYWSTLRAPYVHWDPTRNRHLNLGKRDLIVPLVSGYQGEVSEK